MKNNKDTGTIIATIGLIVGIVLLVMSLGIFIFRKVPESAFMFPQLINVQFFS